MFVISTPLNTTGFDQSYLSQFHVSRWYLSHLKNLVTLKVNALTPVNGGGLLDHIGAATHVAVPLDVATMKYLQGLKSTLNISSTYKYSCVLTDVTHCSITMTIAELPVDVSNEKRFMFAPGYASHNRLHIHFGSKITKETKKTQKYYRGPTRAYSSPILVISVCTCSKVLVTSIIFIFLKETLQLGCPMYNMRYIWHDFHNELRYDHPKCPKSFVQNKIHVMQG